MDAEKYEEHDATMVVTNLTDCLRCGAAHEQLIFQRFQNAAVVGKQTFAWWCLCPTTQEPLLLGLPQDPENYIVYLVNVLLGEPNASA